MFKWISAIAIASVMVSTANGADRNVTRKPTIVLVHGAFADSSSWNGVTSLLIEQGFPVVAVANPLRSVSSDAAYLTTIVNSINTPVVLVGHSYGGSVISGIPKDVQNVKALVFVAAFEPEVGESAQGLSGKFPGSSLLETLAEPVSLPGGAHDLFIQQDKFPHQFAADLPRPTASLMAVAQRPVTDAALKETSQEAAWKRIPSWAVYGTADLNIPPAAMAFMAERAQSRTTVIDEASHVVMVSHPEKVTEVIVQAADE